jgi:hypothetical protein
MSFMVFQVLCSIVIVVLQEKGTEIALRGSVALDNAVKYTQVPGTVLLNMVMLLMGWAWDSDLDTVINTTFILLAVDLCVFTVAFYVTRFNLPRMHHHVIGHGFGNRIGRLNKELHSAAPAAAATLARRCSLTPNRHGNAAQGRIAHDEDDGSHPDVIETTPARDDASVIRVAAEPVSSSSRFAFNPIRFANRVELRHSPSKPQP